MKTTVIGTGRWGTFIGWYLDSINHTVKLYGREDSKHFVQLKNERKNNYLTLTDSILLTSNKEEIIDSDVLFISVGAQNLRDLLIELKEYFIGQPLVLCMKGLEIGTGKRLTQIVSEELGDDYPCAVWLGPGHPQEFTNGVPNCMVIDSKKVELKEKLVNELSSSLIRFYFGSDLVGNEFGAALKNVIGIAAGMLDGLHLSSLKGALMARGCKEVSVLIDTMGGDPISAYGLCHLGDYEATVFSQHSHNRKFGELFVNNQVFDDLAEGYYTVQAVRTISETHNLDLPISTALYQVLFENKDPLETINALFLRSLKQEF